MTISFDKYMLKKYILLTNTYTHMIERRKNIKKSNMLKGNEKYMIAFTTQITNLVHTFNLEFLVLLLRKLLYYYYYIFLYIIIIIIV